MTTPIDLQRPVSRREAIKLGMGGGLGALGVLLAGSWLQACTTGPTATVGAGALAGSSTAWATGGTAAMSGSYPNPFATSAGGEACTLAPSLTVGPCYAETLMRRDISEGLTGLPMRLALRVVDATTCEPVPNATVDVWHTNAAGIYSAYAQGSMCNPSSAEAAKAHFFRGVQTTDEDGRVDFDSVFPGWYSGRTVHIHFTVRVDGKEYVTSQLVFDDTLTDAIFAEHKDYNSRPQRNTTNQNDSVVRSAQAASITLATVRMTDGALQAWKTIAIKSA